MRDVECVAFLKWALPRMGLRWVGFRKPRRQVCRRIARRLSELDLAELADYRRRLDRDGREWAVLDSLCRVTISRFLRDRAVFDALGREVLPEAARRARADGRRALRAWSVGCASGEEPYSLSLVWHFEVAQRAPDIELEIVATDIDEHLLGRARRAIYPVGSLRAVPAGWRGEAFEEMGAIARDGEVEAVGADYRLRGELRRGVELLRQDIRRARPPGRFDLICCRNLAWTYFDADVQRYVLARLTSALRRHGTLVIGAHEVLPSDSESCERIAPSIYRRS